MTDTRLARTIFGILLAGAASPLAAQGLKPVEWPTAGGGTVTLYGQINKGYLSYDDGQDTETYAPIDNGNSSTRLGLRLEQPYDNWTLGTRVEIEYAPFSTKTVSQLEPDGGDPNFNNGDIRWADFSAKSNKLGTFSLGQGSMATDGIAELDLSGTDVIAYASVADSAAGQLLTYGPADLAGFYGPSINSTYSDYDGPRLLRVRYDTRSFNGFGFAIAYGRNMLSDDKDTREINQYDAALRYELKADAYDLKAGFGYFGTDDDVNIWAGSVSAIHKASGFNGTLASGTRDKDGTNGSYIYGKLGLKRDFIDWGATAMSVDYYHGENVFTASDVNVTNTDGDVVLAGDIDDSTSDSWGIGFVQNIAAANTQLWVTWRQYDYSDNLTSYDDGQAVFAGARFKF